MAFRPRPARLPGSDPLVLHLAIPWLVLGESRPALREIVAARGLAASARWAGGVEWDDAPKPQRLPPGPRLSSRAGAAKVTSPSSRSRLPLSVPQASPSFQTLPEVKPATQAARLGEMHGA